MDIQINYPAQTKTKEVRSVNLLLERSIAVVEMWSEQRDRVEVDLEPIVKELIDTELTTIKAFLSKIIAMASGLNENEIPDKIFKIEIKE